MAEGEGVPESLPESLYDDEDLYGDVGLKTEEDLPEEDIPEEKPAVEGETDLYEDIYNDVQEPNLDGSIAVEEKGEDDLMPIEDLPAKGDHQPRKTGEPEKDRSGTGPAPNGHHPPPGFGLPPVVGAVHIGNLQWWTTDAELEAACGEYGQIANIKFLEDKSNGKSKGSAVVEFSDREGPFRCRDHLHGRLINGRNITVTMHLVPGGRAPAAAPRGAANGSARPAFSREEAVARVGRARSAIAIAAARARPGSGAAAPQGPMGAEGYSQGMMPPQMGPMMMGGPMGMGLPQMAPAMGMNSGMGGSFHQPPPPPPRKPGDADGDRDRDRRRDRSRHRDRDRSERKRRRG